ncbi:MAG: 23S rRNA (adenine(2503)-C(2))-methyltransferase RlmN [Planctomycetes bacterium]|nr:23S rRNA (adenine(2503)-C(2))-methyltransferase RlmN [Planctomycetota bacterium]
MKLPIHDTELKTKSLLGVSSDEMGDLLGRWDEKPYRAKQILEWIYDRHVASIDEMTNLSKALREKLAGEFHLFESRIVTESKATDRTQKLLLGWADGQTTECVMIPSDRRRTACISTQVGCPVGCVFCASGLDGVKRNLTTGQIVEQVMRVQRLCEPDERLSNVVFMGLGEPLANYDCTVAALRQINALVGIGARKITVSTVGLPKQIRRLADEQLQFTLALSLHAPTDELRQQLIPWAEGVAIAELVDAVRYYFDKTGREITLEYVLLEGINDARNHAAAVADLCRKMRTNVNLILYNPVPDLPYRRPTDEAARNFLQTLRSKGVNAHLRPSRGMEIDSACGQLRRRTEHGTNA